MGCCYPFVISESSLVHLSSPLSEFHCILRLINSFQGVAMLLNFTILIPVYYIVTFKTFQVSDVATVR